MRKLIIMLCISIFCVIILASCSSPEEKKERYYLKAMEYIKQNDQKSAIIELRNAIQLDAAYADARYQLGLLYLDKREPHNAFRELLRAADLDHANLDANLKAAEYYLINRKSEECRKLVERILENHPNYVDGLALLANLELIEGNFDAAMDVIDRIGGGIVEASDQLLNIQGRIFVALKKLDSAEASFRKAIDVNDANFDNYQMLLALFQQKEEVTKAKALLDQMVKKFPEIPQVHMFLANLYFSLNANEQAEGSFLKAIEVAPHMVQFRLILADFYIRTNKLEMARVLLLKSMNEIPDNPDIIAMLAYSLF